jgi:hypothetical protein
LVWRSAENAASLEQHRARAFDGGWYVFPTRTFDALERSRLV